MNMKVHTSNQPVPAVANYAPHVASIGEAAEFMATPGAAKRAGKSHGSRKPVATRMWHSKSVQKRLPDFLRKNRPGAGKPGSPQPAALAQPEHAAIKTTITALAVRARTAAVAEIRQILPMALRATTVNGLQPLKPVKKAASRLVRKCRGISPGPDRTPDTALSLQRLGTALLKGLHRSLRYEDQAKAEIVVRSVRAFLSNGGMLMKAAPELGNTDRKLLIQHHAMELPLAKLDEGKLDELLGLLVDPEVQEVFLRSLGKTHTAEVRDVLDCLMKCAREETTRRHWIQPLTTIAHATKESDVDEALSLISVGEYKYLRHDQTRSQRLQEVLEKLPPVHIEALSRSLQLQPETTDNRAAELKRVVLRCSPNPEMTEQRERLFDDLRAEVARSCAQHGIPVQAPDHRPWKGGLPPGRQSGPTASLFRRICGGIWSWIVYAVAGPQRYAEMRRETAKHKVENALESFLKTLTHACGNTAPKADAATTSAATTSAATTTAATTKRLSNRLERLSTTMKGVEREIDAQALGVGAAHFYGYVFQQKIGELSEATLETLWKGLLGPDPHLTPAALADIGEHGAHILAYVQNGLRHEPGIRAAASPLTHLAQSLQNKPRDAEQVDETLRCLSMAEHKHRSADQTQRAFLWDALMRLPEGTRQDIKLGLQKQDRKTSFDKLKQSIQGLTPEAELKTQRGHLLDNLLLALA